MMPLQVDSRRSADAPIVQPGRNCWRLATAHRVAVLVDGAAYFRAFAAAAALARSSIFIIGWDFHAGVCLQPDSAETIGVFLQRLVAERPELRVYVLDWDFSLIYALERQFFPRLRLGRWTHPHFRFQLDAQHPAGAAQHQKIVVVDDAVAFVGGFDFGPCRWDDSTHRPRDARRIDPDGRSYGPFHDVMVAVDGTAARALGQLARERWRHATGELVSPVVAAGDVWPRDVEPDLREVEVAIARTLPTFNGRPEVREIEQLYLDAIAAAHHTLYFENQYLTSEAIGEALMRRLQEADGPEVVIVQPRVCQGWLEQTAMGVLRARLMRRLLAADRYRRLRVYYPDVAGLEEDRLNVHAKVLVVDDRLLRVGSANLNNRSMGVDSECDLAIDATDDTHRRGAIAAIRDRLVAEHVGQSPQCVAAEIAARGSLIAAIEALSTAQRGLRLLDSEVEAWLDGVVPHAEWLDPDRPLGAADEPIAGRRERRRQRARRAGSRHPSLLAASLAGLIGAVTRWWQ